MSKGTRSVVVVGGGITGLATAHALIREANREGRALSLTLFEAEGRLGGNIRTVHEGGFVVEAGPDSFVTTRPQALNLCEELGLGPRIIETSPQNRRVYMVRGGKLQRMPEGLSLGIPTRIRPFLRSPLLSAKGKLRALGEMIRPADLAGGDVSVGDFLERRFGREMVDVILAPLLGGIYAGDAYRLSLRSTFPDWFSQNGRGTSLVRLARKSKKEQSKGDPPGSPFRSLVGGMTELIDALAARVGAGTVRLGTKVQAVTPLEGGRFRVQPEGGPSIEADHVVVALPASAAADVVASLDPVLGDELRGIEYVTTATVSLAYRRAQVAHPLDAAGFLVSQGQGVAITAGTFNSSKWPGRAPEGHVLLRAFVGGPHDEGTPRRGEGDLIATVERALAPWLGLHGEPVLAKVFRYIGSSPQPTVGHFERVARIRERLARAPGLYVIGNAYDGVGIPDCVRLAEQAAAEIRASRSRPESIPPARGSNFPRPFV